VISADRSVGVLALQGDVEAHRRVLDSLGCRTRELRHAAELDAVAAVVVPGGESTTLLRLMAGEPWFEALRRFHREGGALLGTCAGAILLAREVRGPAQASLGLLDAVVERNGYGRQRDSFEARLAAPAIGGAPLDAVFIRAPRFRALGPGVEVLAEHGGEPVLVREGRVIAATFHPEIAGESRVHRLLVGAAARELRLLDR
jgi:5'-phosphate synthase pdxT subunit